MRIVWRLHGERDGIRPPLGGWREERNAPRIDPLRRLARATAPARAENRPKGRLSALRAHTKTPYKTDLLWITLRNAEDA
jgi:hypothetical protein